MDFSVLHGNWVDLAILLVIVFYSANGLGRGFIMGLLDLGGFLLSFISAVKFYNFFGELLVIYFSLPKGIANALGFLIAGIISETCFSILINLAAKFIYPKIKTEEKQRPLKLFFKLDHILGIIPAVIEALVITAFLLTLFTSLPIQGNIKKTIVTSKIGGPLVQATQAIEKQINSIFGQAVNETLNFLTISPNPLLKEKVDLGFTQKELKIDGEAETAMLVLVNKEREKEGLKKLSLYPKVSEAARKHATDMFARGYFSHNTLENESPFDRLKNDGISFLAAGENLAYAPNVYLAHQGLMNSPGHRANILSVDFGKIGIGVIDGGIYGEMFVQEFTD